MTLPTPTEKSIRREAVLIALRAGRQLVARLKNRANKCQRSAAHCRKSGYHDAAQVRARSMLEFAVAAELVRQLLKGIR